MSSKQILVVDDEPGIAETLVYILQQQGFTTTSVVSISEARKAIENTTFSAIVLDVGLPDGNGFDFCKELRQKNNETPILFLTARKEEVDQVVGLEIGGDDYVTKPYKSRVVAAKIKAILKRIRDPETNGQDSKFHVDKGKKKITYKGEILQTSPIEYKILKLLIESPGHVFSRDDILDDCWGENEARTPNAVDAHIAAIRKKIKEIDPQSDPRDILKTYTGTGFYLDT